MIPSSRGFSSFNSQLSGQSKINTIGERFPINKTLMEVIKGLDGASTEMVERSKTIFFPGDPAERVYLIRRGAVRLSRVYESGEEITVALLRENSLFGVLSLLTGHRSDRFYHAIAFTRVEMITAPANSVLRAIEEDASVGLLLLQGLSSRILQTETMIETLLMFALIMFFLPVGPMSKIFDFCNLVACEILMRLLKFFNSQDIYDTFFSRIQQF